MSRSQINRPHAPTGLGDDDAGCPILHVDMDAFFASVEVARRPELRGKPMIVGGVGSRGVVVAATYEARRYGIHSAMPMSRALRLAPDVIVVPPDHRHYAEVSASVMELFTSITPFVEPLSLDEAFLDVGGARLTHGPPRRIAESIRAQVFDEQGITCSVGVASTKFVAKLASTQCKPDGLLVVPQDQVVAFLHPMPVGALWGVGERTEEQLHRLGLRTVADIAHTPRATLVRALGQAAGNHLAELAWGRDDRSVTTHERDRSMGAEGTFARDVDDPEVILAELLRLSEKVGARMRRAGYSGTTVSIKVRFADFTTITRSRKLKVPTCVSRDLYHEARALYLGLHLDRARIRLVGVRMEGIVDSAAVQTQLVLGAPEHGWREAEEAIDRLTSRFGRGSVRPARLLPDTAEASTAAGVPRRSGPADTSRQRA
ncbi:MAG: DNA polymerase IV [Candidatus Nanopelagicales bacterium]